MIQKLKGAVPPTGTPLSGTTFVRGILAGTLTLVAACAGSARASAEHPNYLFFGNSFTGSYYPKDVPALLTGIETAAGKPTGTFYRRITSGYSFQAHLQNTGDQSVAYLATDALPEGETWDYVVMQGNSIEATTTMGNPSNFLSSGQAIFDTIRASNPAAKAVLFETWARNENITGFYPTPFANPAAMQTEIATSYRQLFRNLNTADGADSARYAGIGDAFGLLNWPTTIYANEYYHANNRGELLIALTLYGAIHGPTATKLAQSGALDAIATSINLTPADVLPMATVADAAGAPRGDTDLDWDVDFDDLLKLAQNYNVSPTEGNPATWFSGDFNADGVVNFDDLLSLAQNYVPRAPALIGGSAFASDWAMAQRLVPEPMALIGCAVAIPSRRRR